MSAKQNPTSEWEAGFLGGQFLDVSSLDSRWNAVAAVTREEHSGSYVSDDEG